MPPILRHQACFTMCLGLLHLPSCSLDAFTSLRQGFAVFFATFVSHRSCAFGARRHRSRPVLLFHGGHDTI